MIRAVRANGLVKTGHPAAGVAELAEAVAWFARSQLHYTRSLFTLRLAEAHLAMGQRAEARAVIDTVLATARDRGYRHVEGMAERLLAEALGPEDPAALGHVEIATRILEEVGARNDVAKALVTRAACHRAAADIPGARTALEQALEIFTSLGTVDGPPLVAARLDALSARIDADRGSTRAS